MANRYHQATGIIIEEQAIKEADKRLVIVTKEFGKVTVFANGAKKAKSSLLAGSQLFVLGRFYLYQGKTAYTLKQVEILDSFYGLRTDYQQMTLALYLSELTKALLKEAMLGQEMLELLYYAFRHILENKKPLHRIKATFELKALSLSGLAPLMTDCVRCGKNKGQLLLTAFSPFDGGVVCQDCQVNHDLLLPKPLLKSMCYIIERPIKQCYSFNIGQDEQLAMIIRRYLASQLEVKLKSEAMLEL